MQFFKSVEDSYEDFYGLCSSIPPLLLIKTSINADKKGLRQHNSKMRPSQMIEQRDLNRTERLM